MAALPVFPSFLPNDADLGRLQQLSYATQFAARAPVVFHLFKAVNQAIPANTLTAVQWDFASADTDGGWSALSAARYVARTPGYFHADFGVNCATTGVDGTWQVLLRVTTGPNNPGGAGTVTYVAAVDDEMGTSSLQQSLATSAGTPYLYNKDYLEVVVFCTQSTTITAGWNSSGNNDANGFADGSPSFTGMLVSLGP